MKKGIVHLLPLFLVGAFAVVLFFVLRGANVLGTKTGIPADQTGIAADPNPCTIEVGKSTCKSTISWNQVYASTADICVSPAGGKEQLFASVGKGSGHKDAPWINRATYIFKLKIPAKKCAGDAIAQIGVFGQPVPVKGSIAADPNPCTIEAGKSLCKSTISWDFSGTKTADICVSPAGGADQLFASVGKKGSKQAPWINTATYTFKLKTPAKKCGGNTIAQVNVQGAKTVVVTPSASIYADPNPCYIAIQQANCSTNLHWKLSRKGDAEICWAPEKYPGKDFWSDSIRGAEKGISQDAVLPGQNIFTIKSASYNYDCKGTTLASVTVTGVQTTLPRSCSAPIKFTKTTNGSETLIKVDGAWWCAIKADPIWTKVDYDEKNLSIILHFSAKSGTINIYLDGTYKTLIQTYPWSS